MNCPRNDSGFTLLEVVVSVAILAMALGVLFPIFGASPGRLDVAHQRALAAADLAAKIEEQILLEDWQALPRQGEFGAWRWSLEGLVESHTSDSDTQQEFLFKLIGETVPANAAYGTPIRFERIVVRKN